MKRIFGLLLIITCMVCLSFFGFTRPTLYPIYDAPAATIIPRNLRTTKEFTFHHEHLKIPNLEGLNFLQASGSGQFSEETFKEMTQRLKVDPSLLIICDLRQESHGLINGKAVSWTDGIDNYTNIHKTREEIEKDEATRLKMALNEGKIVLSPILDPSKVIVKTVKTEREIVESIGATYVRLPVTDHNRPTDEVIDQFILLARTLSPHQWLHLHCKAGKGRTTTFLTLLDIIKNAQRVPLEDILSRQAFIGGITLKEFSHKAGERKRAAEERVVFIRHFYAYCQQVPDFRISWSEWIKKHPAAIVINP